MYSLVVLNEVVLLVTILCFSHGLSNEIEFRKDYTYIKSLNSAYKLHEQKTNWTVAKETCASEGAKLFIAEDEAEAAAIPGLFEIMRDHDGSIWVGISKVSSKYNDNFDDNFQTIDGRRLTDVYNNWDTRQGEPRRRDLYDCLILRSKREFWNTICDNPHPFVCKYTPGAATPAQPHSGESTAAVQTVTPQTDLHDQHTNGLPQEFEAFTYLKSMKSAYHYHPISANWTDAEEICASEGAQLFYAEDKAEAIAIFDLFVINVFVDDDIWVGISKSSNDSFETIDRRPLNDVYHNWDETWDGTYMKYLNSITNDCVVSSAFLSFRTIPCNKTQPFVCKYRPVEATPIQLHSGATPTEAVQSSTP